MRRWSWTSSLRICWKAGDFVRWSATTREPRAATPEPCTGGSDPGVATSRARSSNSDPQSLYKVRVASGIAEGRTDRREPEGGSALLPVMLMMFLFSAIALGASVVIRVEISVADRFRQSAEALYAADAGLAGVLAELRTLPGWTPVLDGSRRSGLSQGIFSGSKAVPGGGVVLICCGPQSAADRLASDTRLSPLPARRSVQWRPFLWTTLDALAPSEPPSRFFIVVWVADDEADGDGDGSTDENGIVIVRSEALEPNGLRRIVEAYVARPPENASEQERAAEEPEAGTAVRPAVDILRWREVR
jgi:hypothetical protein